MNKASTTKPAKQIQINNSNFLTINMQLREIVFINKKHYGRDKYTATCTNKNKNQREKFYKYKFPLKLLDYQLVTILLDANNLLIKQQLNYICIISFN